MKVTYTKFIVRLLIFIYLCMISWVLFVNMGTIDRKIHFKEPIAQLIPFQNSVYYFKTAYAHDFSTPYTKEMMANIGGNLFLLFPWGFLSPLAFPKLASIKRIVVSGFLISLSAELVQYIFKLGVFDIDDIIYNTLGAIAGYYFLQLTQKVQNKRKY